MKKFQKLSSDRFKDVKTIGFTTKPDSNIIPCFNINTRIAVRATDSGIPVRTKYPKLSHIRFVFSMCSDNMFLNVRLSFNKQIMYISSIISVVKLSIICNSQNHINNSIALKNKNGYQNKESNSHVRKDKTPTLKDGMALK